MRKKKFLLCLLMTCMASTLVCGTCGCGSAIKNIKQVAELVTESQNGEDGSDAESGDRGSENDGLASSGTDAVADVSTLVTAFFEEEGTYTIVYDDENKYDYEYSYSLPQIEADTEGAKAINQEIQEYFSDILSFAAAHSDGDEISESSELWISKTEYDAYKNGDVLSILIESVPYYGDGAMYLVFNYDVNTGKVLDNQALLKQAGHSEEEFLKGIRRAAVYESDRQQAYFFEYSMPMDEEMYEDYIQQNYTSMLRMRYNTMSEKNINMEIPVFLDGEGDITAIVNVEVPAGSGVYPAVLKPIDVPQKPVQKTGSEEYVAEGEKSISVSYDEKEGIFSICIYDTEWSRRVFDQAAIEFGKTYQVLGSNKFMTDYAFALTGNMIVPYFVALSEDGMLSYMDLEACVRGGSFCLAEPMWGCKDIVALNTAPYDGENEEIQGIFLESEDGTVTGLAEILYSAVIFRYDGFSKDMLSLWEGEGYNTDRHHVRDDGVAYDSQYYLGFDPEYPSRFLWQNYLPDMEVGKQYEGYVTWLGMDANGIILEIVLFTDDENMESCSSIYYFQKHPYWDEINEVQDDGATMRWISGTDLFDSENEPVEFTISCG